MLLDQLEHLEHLGEIVVHGITSPIRSSGYEQGNKIHGHLEKEGKGEDSGRMAGLFDKQAKEYADVRPQYPPELFSFIASHTPNHDVAWDVGTGSGQAAAALSDRFRKVIATDISERQLSFARKRPNITYAATPPVMSVEELQSIIGPGGSVDLVTVAQAIHWFDLDAFYAQAKHVLRKPGGVFAAWCYRWPLVNAAVDEVFRDLYSETAPLWESARHLVDEEYETLEFPFQAIEGLKSTGPLRFEARKDLTLREYLRCIRTWSVFQTAESKGVRLLDERMLKRFEAAWGSQDSVLTVTWPLTMRIGTV